MAESDSNHRPETRSEARSGEPASSTESLKVADDQALDPCVNWERPRWRYLGIFIASIFVALFLFVLTTTSDLYDDFLAFAVTILVSYIAGGAFAIAAVVGLSGRSWLLSLARGWGLVMAAAFFALMWLAAFEGSDVWGGDTQGFAEIVSILVATSCFGTFAVCHPMYILRRFAGWRLDVPLRLSAPGPRPSIEGLLWSTGGIACLLGVARLPDLATQASTNRFGPYSSLILLYTTIPLAVVAWVLLPFMTRIAFAPKKDGDEGLAMVTWVVGFFALLFLSVLAVIVLSGMFGGGPPMRGSEFGYVVLSFLVMSGAFAFGTYLARVGGFRFGFAPRGWQSTTTAETTQQDVFDEEPERSEYENENAGSTEDAASIRSLRLGGVVLLLLTALSTLVISQMTATARSVYAARQGLAKQIMAAGGGWSWDYERKCEVMELAGSLSEDQVSLVSDETLKSLGIGEVELSASSATELFRNSTLKSLSIRSESVSMETILLAAEHLTKLRRLDLSGVSFTVDELNALLEQLPQCRDLDISGCKLTVDQIASLHIHSLSHLRLRGMNLSDKQAGTLLDALSTVHSWDLSDNPLQGTFLRENSRYRIWLDDTEFDDTAASQMQIRKNRLLHLSVIGTRLSGKGLARIAPSLASLRVGQGNIGESDLAALSLPNLQSLALRGPEFTGARLQNWMGWNTIETLDLSGSGYTDQNRGIFQNTNALKHLSLASTAATTATLSVVPQYLEIDIRGTSIRPADVRNVRRLYIDKSEGVFELDSRSPFPTQYSVNVTPPWLQFAGMGY